MKTDLSGIPQFLIDKFIPQIKRANGSLLREIGEEMERIMAPFQAAKAVHEMEFQALYEKYPPSLGTAESEIQHLEGMEAWRQDFTARYPEYVAAMEDCIALQERYAEAERDILAAFCADGGTEDQYHTLRGAVLNREFSRPAPAEDLPDLSGGP
jgi:hypothetical protein